MGFNDYKNDGKINKLPVLLGFQAEGAAPIVKNEVVKDPQTIATAIRIGNPASWDKAVNALKESNGQINAISDEKILEAYKMLASNEGIFSDPASCITLAGILYLKEKGVFKGGNGLKDPTTSLSQIPAPQKIDATKESVMKLMRQA